MVFDKNGNLLVANFGDGTIYKLILNKEGKVINEEVFAKLPNTAGADGINIDDKGNFWVAGFSLNHLFKIG